MIFVPDADERSFPSSLASFIPFRDREACERVRRIRRADLCRHPNSEFRIRVIDEADAFYLEFALDLVGRIQRSREGGRRLVLILPVGPMPQYSIAVRMINELRLSCHHVVTFNMDEYADEDGNTAPVQWPGSFQRSMMENFFGRIDADLRPPESQIHFPVRAVIDSYSRRIEDAGGADVCYGGIGWCGHIAFWEAHLGSGVRQRPGQLQTGRRPPGRTASHDHHAERAALLRRGLVMGSAEGQHHRAARYFERAPPQFLARWRPGRRRELAALYRATGGTWPGQPAGTRLDSAAGQWHLYHSRRRGR